MTTTIQAMPTQYRGIRFKSKSEAQFALMLDLLNASVTADNTEVYETADYEPKWLKLEDGYMPDFLITRVSRQSETGGWFEGQGATLFRDLKFMTVVEYKPSRPTDAYLEMLSNRFEEINTRLNDVSEPSYIFYLVAYGGFYGSPPGELGWLDVQRSNGIDQWIERKESFQVWPQLDTFRDVKDKVLSYRFDLA